MVQTKQTTVQMIFKPCSSNFLVHPRFEMENTNAGLNSMRTNKEKTSLFSQATLCKDLLKSNNKTTQRNKFLRKNLGRLSVTRYKYLLFKALWK